MRPRGRPAVHRHPGVRDPKFSSLGDVLSTTKSGIRTPKDLEGRKVGVNRGYTVTTGLWARGILQSEYGVDLNKVTWIPTDDEHVAGFAAPKNVDYSFRGAKMRDLLLSGEIDAAIGEVAVDAPEIKPLIPDAQNAAFDYFRKTGDLSDQPRRGGQGFGAEGRAVDRGRALPRVRDGQGRISEEPGHGPGATATSWDKAAKVNAEVVGDPFPFGIETEPQGAGGDHAVRGGSEDGAAEVFGRRVVRAAGLTAASPHLPRRATVCYNAANKPASIGRRR